MCVCVCVCVCVCARVKLLLSCPTLCNPMDCNSPGSSVHGILQARILEWVAIPFSRHLPDSGIEPRSPALQAYSLPSEPHREAPLFLYSLLKHVSLHTGQCWWEPQSGGPDLLGIPPPKKPSEKPQSSPTIAPQPTKWATPHLHPSDPPRTLPNSNHFPFTVWT